MSHCVIAVRLMKNVGSQIKQCTISMYAKRGDPVFVHGAEMEKCPKIEQKYPAKMIGTHENNINYVLTKTKYMYDNIVVQGSRPRLELSNNVPHEHN